MDDNELIKELLPAISVAGTYIVAVLLPSFIFWVKESYKHAGVRNFARQNAGQLASRHGSQQAFSSYVNSIGAGTRFWVILANRSIVPILVVGVFVLVSFTWESYLDLAEWLFLGVLFFLLLKHEDKFSEHWWYRSIVFLFWILAVFHEIPMEIFSQPEATDVT
ncbi:MAG: hypothetical protein RLP15_04550 [Cryomorphaceae bacterium]